MRVNDLRRGSICYLQGRRLKVLYKNDCRVLVQSEQQTRSFRDRNGNVVKFKVPGEVFSISPGTCVDRKG